MKKCFAVLALVLYASFAFACSTFLLHKNGHYYFGRNYDWVTGNGALIINSRGVHKTSFTPEGGKTISWISRWGSTTFNQFGKEFPHGGMNEKGLVVELMWLDETAYPAVDNRAALNELQWIQYQLDNCSTVAEVLATDKLLRISRQGAAPLHYLVADAAGNAATIEFISGKMVVHTGNNLAYPVLTNTVYDEAVQGAKQKSTADNSVARFATACRLVQQYEQGDSKEDGVTAAFSILNQVAQGSFTKWRIVYDITGRSLHFITTDGSQPKDLSLNDLNFSCIGAAPYLSLHAKESGAIKPLLAPLTFEGNKSLLQQSAKESESRIHISAASVNAAAAYFKEVGCKP